MKKINCATINMLILIKLQMKMFYLTTYPSGLDIRRDFFQAIYFCYFDRAQAVSKIQLQKNYHMPLFF